MYALEGRDFEFKDLERVAKESLASRTTGRDPSKDGRDDTGDLGRSSVDKFLDDRLPNKSRDLLKRLRPCSHD